MFINVTQVALSFWLLSPKVNYFHKFEFNSFSQFGILRRKHMFPSPVSFLYSNKSKVTILSTTQVIKKGTVLKIQTSKHTQIFYNMFEDIFSFSNVTFVVWCSFYFSLLSLSIFKLTIAIKHEIGLTGEVNLLVLQIETEIIQAVLTKQFACVNLDAW